VVRPEWDDRTVSQLATYDTIGVGYAVIRKPGTRLAAFKPRNVFRTEIGLDDDAWHRGRGWALFVGLAGLP
jgi:hypothetical protein